MSLGPACLTCTSSSGYEESFWEMEEKGRAEKDSSNSSVLFFSTSSLFIMKGKDSGEEKTKLQVQLHSCVCKDLQ